MVRYATRMLENWQPGDLRDVHADSMALTLRLAAKALFDAEVDKDVAEIGRAFTTPSWRRFPFGSAVPSASPTPFRRRATSAMCAGCIGSIGW